MTRVLVVDDSEDLQEALEMVLTDAGFDVAGALDGARGLQLTRELHPDVILLDMMMPEMDGLEFLAGLSTQPSPPPVVAQSGFPAFRAEAMRRGAHAFLLKPISAEVLLGALRSAIEQCPVGPSVLTQNAADVERARLAASEKTTAAVSRLDEHGAPSVRDGLRRIVSWLPTYFGFGTSVVNGSRDGEGRVEAVHGEMATRFEEGARYPAESSYCDDVVAAGSTLLLTDPVSHPVEHFAHHKALAYGMRFYAGVPMKAPSGAVLGTLCILHTRPHEFRSEDMRVLDALGRDAARGMEANVWPLDDEGTFRREHLELFIDVTARRATREGCAGIGLAVEPGEHGGLVQGATGLAAVKLDGHLALLWSGPANGWTPAEALARHTVAKIELFDVRDPDTAARRLRAICT
jgi:CheY-like chemotaxis protein